MIVLPKNRAEAKATGSVAYFTGSTCKNGHVAERFTINGGCKTCQEDRRQKVKAERMDEWRAAQRDYRERNKDNERERQRKWASENRDKANARALRYYQRNAELCRQKTKEWREANPFGVRAQQIKRKNRVNSGGSHTASDIKGLFQKQKGKCVVCRTKLKEYHVDHITPLARGGSNDRKNLQLLCPPCNRSKWAKDPIAFMQSRGFLL